MAYLNKDYNNQFIFLIKVAKYNIVWFDLLPYNYK